MANFKKGDRVKIIDLEDEDKTGEIRGRGDEPNWVKESNVLPPKEEIIIYWWKVKLDGTGEEKEFPDDKLVLIN